MSKISTASQNFVAIKTIKDNVVVLKSGQICSVLLASSINFALKSTEEQEAILHQFQVFLNSIDFSLQMFVQSRRLNIEPYLAILKSREAYQDNDLMRVQLREYMEYIVSLTEVVDVMTKSFFIVVPYSPTPINITKGITSLFTAQPQKKSSSSDQTFEENRTQLEQRVSLVIEGLSGIGIRTVPLKTDDLVELYYHIYNPTDATGKAPSLDI